ncbi:MAG: hypothetical protein M1817_002661 [Caeruleum heppii]|nr:MAG: hypothetical protein M1817_002661 [Caeruleum heppii]
MSEDDYSAFLDQANQDTGAKATSTGSHQPRIKAIDAEVPSGLQKIDRFYVSDADEPFEQFRDLVRHTGLVSSLTVDQWDPKSEYKDIVQAIEEASAAEHVRIYRIEHSKTKLEYFIVALDQKSSKIVGLRTRAVET